MPLVNGYKYSCQPCIRGHRATSCNHTDRVLIEVRKPGRPLESCGHRLDTCSCGRLQDIFSIGGAPPTQAFPQNQDPKAAPRSQIASPILHPRSKSTSSSTSKISKRTAKKKAFPSPTAESISSKSPTPTTSPPPQNSSSFSPINLPQPQSHIPQTQIWASTPLHPGSGQLASSPFTPYQPSRRSLPSHNPNNFSNPHNANGAYSVAPNSGQSVVEDLRMVSSSQGQQGQQGQVYSRSQFMGGGGGGGNSFSESPR